MLQRREIEIAWQNEYEAIVQSGLEAGELLVTTPLGQITSGIRVTAAAPRDETSGLATKAASGSTGTEASP